MARTKLQRAEDEVRRALAAVERARKQGPGALAPAARRAHLAFGDLWSEASWECEARPQGRRRSAPGVR